MKFRLYQAGDYDFLRRLWAQAFGEEEPWTSWFFREHFRPDSTWVGELDGRVMAQAHLVPHTLMLRGAWRQTAYFVGVCVDESLQGQGFGRELMRTALAELRRRNVTQSILQPRYPDFYRRLGWSYSQDRQPYLAPLLAAALQLPPAAPGWECSGSGAEILAPLYAEFTRARHAYARRSLHDWRTLLDDHRGEGGVAVAARVQGRPGGYALYNVSRGTAYIRELVWLDPAALPALLRQVVDCGLAAGRELLEWLDPAGDPGLPLDRLGGPEPFLMGRIGDVRTWAATLDYPPELTADWTLQLDDPLAEWNHGLFHWHIRDGRGSLTPAKQQSAPDLRLGIDRLSQLYFGYAGAARLDGGDLAGTTAGTILAGLFPFCRNYISEYF